MNLQQDAAPKFTARASDAPIFILGISQRSGTNFLFDLLRLHPDCEAPSINWEDFLLHKSDMLAEYVTSVFQGWSRRGHGPEVKELLYESLGTGLISVLQSRVNGKRVITKTPSVRNLGRFFRLFPRAYLLLLIRDGRAVVESRVKSFGETYEMATRVWAEAADTILRFVEDSHESCGNYLIVRYEDLWSQPERELRRIFAFVGLNPTTFDFGAATDIPVRGSSVFRGGEAKDLHWRPIKKTPDFNPVLRFADWSICMHRRFNWLAGHQQKQLGYDEEAATEDNLLWIAWNEGMDLKWRLTRAINVIKKAIKQGMKRLIGEKKLLQYRRRALGIEKVR